MEILGDFVMKSKMILAALLLGLGVALTVLGAQRPGPKGIIREQTVERQTVYAKGSVSWSGSVVIEETANALIINPGTTMRSHAQAINLQLDAEEYFCQSTIPQSPR